MSLKFISDFFDWQADDIAPQTVDGLDKHFAVLLYAVGTGFVQDIDYLTVLKDGFIRQRLKMDSATGDPGAQNLRIAPESDSGEDLVGPACKCAEHPPTVSQVDWLSKNLAILDHDGVGGQDQLSGVALCNLCSLCLGDGQDMRPGSGLAIPTCFGPLGGIDGEEHTGLIQETPSAGRL